MRYRGSGIGEWRGDWYRYEPSIQDHRTAREYGDAVAARRAADPRNGYGPKTESRPEWEVRGFLGEVAALHPLRSGPELGVRSRGWTGQADFGPLEVRTTSYHALRGGRSPRYPTLAGWPIFSKDARRIIVAVEERDDDLVVMGWTWARDVPRLAAPVGGVLAVVDYGDLRPLWDLAPYAESLE